MTMRSAGFSVNWFLFAFSMFLCMVVGRSCIGLGCAHVLQVKSCVFLVSRQWEHVVSAANVVFCLSSCSCFSLVLRMLKQTVFGKSSICFSSSHCWHLKRAGCVFFAVSQQWEHLVCAANVVFCLSSCSCFSLVLRMLSKRCWGSLRSVSLHHIPCI